MQNKTPTKAVSPESLERKYEVSEKSVRNVLIVFGAALFLLLLGLVTGGVLMRVFADNRPMQNMQPLGIVIAPDLKPLERFPKPILNIDDDHAEMTASRAAQIAELNSYGWIDRSNGIVRIPIQRAMDLLLERGLPTQTNGTPSTGESPLTLIQKIQEQR
ncbi:MAG TPA: hypothetical protein VGN23_11345 [Verrucomicrobiae bacterium]|jgi:hypothetical protein